MLAEPRSEPGPESGPAPAVVPSVVDGLDIVGALSPSRAGDFTSCPLLYRFRSVDKLPEPTSPVALRGTLVHAVLEHLFDLPAAERTAERAVELVRPCWEALVEQAPELAEVFADPDDGLARWLLTCANSVRAYFSLEDPTRLEPAERELYVETLLDSRLLLRGIVDRIDVAPDGAIRVVDYKTGRAPAPGFEADALFQLRFYALVLWRQRGVVPRLIQLLYIGSGERLSYEPDLDELLATQRKVEAVWQAIATAADTGEWLPRRSGRCTWCSFKNLCPAWGGTPPPLPTREEPSAEPGPRL